MQDSSERQRRRRSIRVENRRAVPFFQVAKGEMTVLADHFDSRQLAYARSVWVALIELANTQQGETVEMPRRELAALAGASPSTLDRVVRGLEDAGLLVRVSEVDGQPCRWILLGLRMETRERLTNGTGGEGGSSGGLGGVRLTDEGGSSGGLTLKDNAVKEQKEARPNGLVNRPDADPVDVVFRYWQQTCKHPTAKLTSDRQSKVRARLRDGYTVKQLLQAIDGAAVGAFVNDNGVRFDDLELICRNGSKVESFIARATARPSGAMGGTARPSEEWLAQLDAKVERDRVQRKGS